MQDVLIFIAVVGAVSLILTVEFGRRVDIDHDRVSMRFFGRTRHIGPDQVDRALVRFDAFGSMVVIITGRSNVGSIVMPVTARERDGGKFSRLVELLRRASEHGAQVEPEVFEL
ncbi:MAG: hypothetical protein ACKOI2_12795 [Actinomycetota bacterium]